MNLINIENYELNVNPNILLIRPFRKLWNSDRSKAKEKFYQQLSYLYFMVDPRSSYSYITEDAVKSKTIIDQEGLPKDFKPSETLKEAMEIYRKQTVTKSYELLESTYKACDKIRIFLENVNLSEEDDKGKPKYQISSITSAIDKILGLIEKLQILKKKVEQDVEETTRARGTDKKMFEDGFDFNS